MLETSSKEDERKTSALTYFVTIVYVMQHNKHNPDRERVFISKANVEIKKALFH